MVTYENEDYSRGLNDAWKLARKIAGYINDGGYTGDELKKIFGSNRPASVLLNYTAEEALAKIESYESDKEIKVGDVVNNGKLNGVVTSVGIDCVYLIYEDGVNGFAKKSYCKKTGRHIDIESILKQI